MAGRSRDGGSVRKLTVCLVYLLTLLGELSVTVMLESLLCCLSLYLFSISFSLAVSLVITILPPLLLLLATMSPYQSLSSTLRRRFPLVPYGGHVTRSTWESFIRAGGNATIPLKERAPLR